MAASVLAYIHAWDVMRMMAHQHLISRPPAYSLVSATGEEKGDRSMPASNTLKPNGAAARPVMTASNGRPLSRKDPPPKANGAAARRTNGRSVMPAATAGAQTVESGAVRAELVKTAVSTERPLKYGDGCAVDGQNSVEVQTYRRYVAEKKAVPETRAALLDHDRQQAPPPVAVAGR